MKVSQGLQALEGGTVGGTAQITLLGTLSYPLPCSSTPWCPAWPASSHFSLLGYIGFFGGGLYSQPDFRLATIKCLTPEKARIGH